MESRHLGGGKLWRAAILAAHEGKNKRMQINRRHFIGGMAAAGAGSLLGVPASGRVARVGLVTDTHVGTTMESCARVRAALELF